MAINNYDESNYDQAEGDPIRNANRSTLRSVEASKPSISELDRLADQLAKQRDMLNILESKLAPVSNRQPQDSEDSESERIHISYLVNYVLRNNSHLDRLINEIVL